MQGRGVGCTSLRRETHQEKRSKSLYQVQLLPPREVTAEKLGPFQVLPTTPAPAPCHGPPGPDIAMETVMTPQTSPYSHGIQELSAETGGDLVIVFTDERAGRQSQHVLCGGLRNAPNYSSGFLKESWKSEPPNSQNTSDQQIDHFAEGATSSFPSMDRFPGARPSSDGDTPTAPGPHVLENGPDKERAGGSDKADVSGLIQIPSPRPGQEPAVEGGPRAPDKPMVLMPAHWQRETKTPWIPLHIYSTSNVCTYTLQTESPKGRVSCSGTAPSVGVWVTLQEGGISSQDSRGAHPRLRLESLE